jgi:hypothetical protein
MPDTIYDLEGSRVFESAAEGPPPRNSRDATDLISAAWSQKATLVVIPVDRLGDDFFRLRTGIAGEIVQKFVAYQLRLAIVGDISRYVDESTALRDFVHECNKGEHVWFLPDVGSVAKRLSVRKQVSPTP